MPRSASAEQLVEAAAAERHLLGGALHLDELAAARHHDVHVDLGRRVLDVVQVEQRLRRRRCPTLIAATQSRSTAVGCTPGIRAMRVGQRDEAAGDGGRARAAVGLDHVAVDPHRALAELARDR